MTGMGEAAAAYAAAGYAGVPAARQATPRQLPGLRAALAPLPTPSPPASAGTNSATASTPPPATRPGWGAGGPRWPQANIGARVPASLLVLDIDPRHGGHQHLAQLEREHGPLPPTRVSVSGRGDGGQHRWFLHPGGAVSAAQLGGGLDLKTHAGYVVLPPSRHPATGQPYTWAEPTLEPADLPPDWRQLLAPTPQPAPAARRPPRPAAGLGRQRGRAVQRHDQLDPRSSAPTAGAAPTPTRTPTGPAGATLAPPTPRAPPSAMACCSSTRHATPFQPTEAGAPHGYSRFRAYAVLEHGGDLRAAARALRARTR